MKSVRVWGARLAALMAAIIIPACGSGNPGATAGNSSLWISGSTTGTNPGPSTGLFWTPPNQGNSTFYIADPYDVRTYTRPDIYFLGNNHPLMTDIPSKNFPNIIFNEDRAMVLINQHRKKTFEDILGKPLPYTLVPVLTDHTGLRQNARAHSKHYAVWLPNTPLPQVNHEGDNVAARLGRSGLTTAGVGQLVASGINYRSGDDVATYWISIAGQGPPAPGQPIPPGQLILDIGASHMSVGFWQLGGTGQVYYWTCIIAKDPNTAVTLPTLPFGGPGF